MTGDPKFDALASQAKQLASIATEAIKQRDRLAASNAELVVALERIANSVALGVQSKQISNAICKIFLGIEREARAALEKAKP